MKHSVLIADDDEDSVESLIRALSRLISGAHFVSAYTPEQATTVALHARPSVIVQDLSIDPAVGPESGFSLLQSFRELLPRAKVIMLTGHGSVKNGGLAIQLGASSFLEKPANIAQLAALISDGMRFVELEAEYRHLKGRAGEKELLSYFPGESPATRKLRDNLQEASETSQSVLLLGETGVGKGFCARLIHSQSARESHHFVRYQPLFTTGDLSNSDLFGHIKGAFTGANEARRGLLEEAHHGTFFLDEVDSLPLETQVLFLGVLQERTFRPVGSSKELRSDFRLITATNADPAEAIRAKRLREDLYHRFARKVIQIPSLRERIIDLPEIASCVLTNLRRVNGDIEVLAIEGDALSKLAHHPWPGNIRQLESALESAAYRAQRDDRLAIRAEDVQLDSAASAASFQERVSAFKLELIHQAIAANGGNKIAAARELGIGRSTLMRLIGGAS